MTARLDLNADVGEHDGPPSASDLALLRLLTSASIACGAHAGDAASMRATALACAALGVQIGAHPSYPDREGFGRRAMTMTPAAIADTVARQVSDLQAIALSEGLTLRHVKPHGALYNTASRDAREARAVVEGIARVDRTLALYAPCGSRLWEAGREAGLRVVAEGFLDRAYEDDGSLTSRQVAGAVIHDAEAACDRAIEWARTGHVRTRTGRLLALPLETLCVHGDTPDAALIAARVRAGLEAAGVRLLPSLA